MGFWGTFVVSRTGRELPELGGEPDWRATDGDWQVVRVPNGEDPGDALMEATGSPTLVAQVADSDFAVVHADTPEGVPWDCVLGAASAEASGMPHEMIPSAENVVGFATSWAAETGHRADAEALDAVLRADADPFAEDLVHDLLHALGFRFERP